MRIFGKKWLVMVLACLAVGLLVACGNDAENIPAEPTTEAVQEEVSTAEVSEEVISEEVSETESDVTEIINGVEMVYCTNFDELSEYVSTLDSSVFVEYSFANLGTIASGQAILYDGAHYTMREDSYLHFLYKPGVKEVSSELNKIELEIEVGMNGWFVIIWDLVEDKEIPFTIEYEDGSQELFTVYVTKDWYGSWEEGYIPVETKLEVEGNAELTSYDSKEEFLEYLKTEENEGVAIGAYIRDANKQALLYDGSHCSTNESLEFRIADNGIYDIVAPGWISVALSSDEGFYSIKIVDNYMLDMTLPLDILYDDGTKEKITVNIHCDEW